MHPFKDRCAARLLCERYGNMW